MRGTFETADRLFGKLSTWDDWKDVCVGMRAAGVRLLHYAQAFQECIHFFGENPVNVAKSVPTNQPCSDRLREAAASSEQSLNAKSRLLSWTAKQVMGLPLLRAVGTSRTSPSTMKTHLTNVTSHRT